MYGPPDFRMIHKRHQELVDDLLTQQMLAKLARAERAQRRKGLRDALLRLLPKGMVAPRQPSCCDGC